MSHRARSLLRQRDAMLWLVAGCAFVSACDACASEPEQTFTPPPTETFPLAVAPRPIATDEAFDLVRVTDGVALVWSPPFGEGGGVRMIRLDAHGTPVGEEIGVYAPGAQDRTPPDAFVVRAAAGGGRLAIAWVERAPFTRAVQATHGPDNGEGFAPVADLAELGLETSPVGGLGAAASEDGSLAVMFRTPDTPCPDGVGAPRVGEPCARIRMTRLGVDTSGRGGLGLAIPNACERPITSYLWATRTWHYAVCSRPEETPRTTVYAIAFDPEYAHAEETLSGCEPLGLSPIEGGAVMAGACDDRVDALVMQDSGRELTVLEGIERELECGNGIPTIRLVTAHRTMAWELPGPVDRIEHLLPPALAPTGSRAVWTGETLLVAAAGGSEVIVRRYHCRRGAPMRTDML